MQELDILHLQDVEKCIQRPLYDFNSLHSCHFEPISDSSLICHWQLKQLVLSYLGVWSTNERLKTEPFSFHLDQRCFSWCPLRCLLTKLRHLGFLTKSLVFKFDSALLDDIEVSWYSLKIVDDLSSMVGFDLELTDQTKHISCEKWNQFEVSLIDRIDSNEPVLATCIVLRGSSLVSFT